MIVSKKGLAAATATIVLASAGVAFAYFTGTGSGEGSGRIAASAGGDDVDLVVDNFDGLYPGRTIQNVPVRAVNISSEPVTVESFEVVDVTTDVEGCRDEWFVVDDVQFTATDLNPGQKKKVGTVDVTMINAPVSQDDCRGALVTVTVQAPAGPVAPPAP